MLGAAGEEQSLLRLDEIVALRLFFRREQAAEVLNVLL